MCVFFGKLLWQIFEKKSQVSNVIKVRLVGAELFHGDGRTDMTKLIVTFSNFTKAPKSTDKILRIIIHIRTESYSVY